MPAGPGVLFTPRGSRKAASTPPRKPLVCIHLGDPLPGQTCGCTHKLRRCDVWGVCSTGRSPAEHWCEGCPDKDTE